MCRQCGVLVDNLAMLDQLDTDITNFERELQGEEDHEKKHCTEEVLQRLHDECASRLEAAVANCGILHTHFNRIREMVDS